MSARTPKYLRQKRSSKPDAAYTRIDGKRVYLGLYDSPESRQKYTGLLNPTIKSSEGSTIPTVNELLVSFLRHAKSYYRLTTACELIQTVPVKSTDVGC